jgi:hypothetical protein
VRQQKVQMTEQIFQINQIIRKREKRKSCGMTTNVKHNLSKSKFNKFDLKVISLVSFHLIFLTLFFKQSCEYLSEN